MDVKMPDGTVIQNVPDGITQTELQRRYAAHTDAYVNQAKTDSTLQNVVAGVGGAAYGIPLAVREILGKAQPGEVEDWKRSMAGLWSTPGGAAGTILGGAATAAPAILIPGANTALGAAAIGAGYGALQPVGDDGSRLANTVVGMGGGVAGKYAGDLIGKGVEALTAGRNASLAAQKAANSVRDATMGEVQGAGYVIPPSQVNPTAPGVVNRVLEGFAGKLNTAQAAGIKNQSVTDALAKQALGLPADVPLTVESLQGVRKVAGAAYEQAKKAGTMQADDVFRNDLSAMVSEYRSLADNFPTQRNAAIDSLIKDLDRPEISSSHAVELVKRLRHDGFKNVRSPDPVTTELGRVQLGAQNALEDLLDRHLQQTGNGDFLQVFRNARQAIAKSYTVENALEESTGKVVASKIGREYSKGKPLTGELATIGKMAESFPKAVQNVNTSMPGLSPLDAMGGMFTGAASGNPMAGLWPLLRPVARSAILSKPYQSAMAQPSSYQMGLLGNVGSSVGQSEATKRLLELLGPGAALAIAPQ